MPLVQYDLSLLGVLPDGIHDGPFQVAPVHAEHIARQQTVTLFEELVYEYLHIINGVGIFFGTNEDLVLGRNPYDKVVLDLPANPFPNVGQADGGGLMVPFPFQRKTPEMGLGQIVRDIPVQVGGGQLVECIHGHAFGHILLQQEFITVVPFHGIEHTQVVQPELENGHILSLEQLPDRVATVIPGERIRDLYPGVDSVPGFVEKTIVREQGFTAVNAVFCKEFFEEKHVFRGYGYVFKYTFMPGSLQIFRWLF
jgi:hypothetical protein